MKQVIAFIFSITFLGSNTEIHQLIKLPKLANHFLHHKTENGKISFIDFLQLHYSANHPIDNDENEDNNLPFKSTTNIAHTDVTIVHAKKVNHKVEYIIVGKKHSMYCLNIPNTIATSIFHPPQFG
jgi:hypothetical protein